MNPDSWTAEDIKAMPMEEYLEVRKDILGQLSDRTLEELQKLDKIPKPPPRFHFEGF